MPITRRDPSDPSAARERLPREAEQALSREGLEARRVTPVSPQRHAGLGRDAWRVELASGGTLKLRCLEDEATATELSALRAGLDKAFTRVLARHGRVLLEEWAEGTTVGALGDDAPEGVAFEAGALLARLHGTRPRVPLPAPSFGWLDQAQEELARLRADGTLAPGESDALEAVIGGWDCRQAPAVLVHRDFCGENMLVEPGGTLRVFDNERFKLEPAGFDLGRSHSRWPMTDTHWRRFCEGYLSHAPADPGPIRFWQVVVSLWSLHLRRQRDPDDLASPLEALRRLT